MQRREVAFRTFDSPGHTLSKSSPRRLRRPRSLSSFPLFEGVSGAELERLSVSSRTRAIEKGRMVYLPGDPAEHLYLVVSGRIKVSRLSDGGKELILDILEPGSLFGEADVVDETVRESMAEAIEPSVIWTIPAAAFRGLLARNPTTVAALMKLMGRRRRSLERRLLDVVHKNAPERLARLLLDLARRYGVPDARGTLLRIKLSQTALGNWLGVSREIVNHTFSDLKRRGVIELVEGRVIIRSVDELAAQAA